MIDWNQFEPRFLPAYNYVAIVPIAIQNPNIEDSYFMYLAN